MTATAKDPFRLLKFTPKPTPAHALAWLNDHRALAARIQQLSKDYSPAADALLTFIDAFLTHHGVPNRSVRHD